MAIFGQSNEDFSTSLITQADKSRASDIHLDPYGTRLLVRFRIDGLLSVAGEYRKEDHENMIRKLKVLVQLNIAESRIPQQARGQIVDSASGKAIDFRVSTFPTVFGEAAVIHMIDKKKEIFDDFESMGMNPSEVELMKNTITRPYGMILVVGPAGSGKTSTLYTALNQIRSPEKNIVTLEDPVEFELEFVRHSQIRPEVGFTFAEGMKAVLRQDPDVVFIGEILDHETAEIAVRAALSGRLVFSNISTNDSIGTITRFLELGIPRSFLATTLLLTISKRLLRKNCEFCRLPYMPAEKFLKALNFSSTEQLPFRKGSGCDKCEQRGYFGQIPIFELFAVDKKISDLIMEGAITQDLLKAAAANKMRTLRDAALEHVMAGSTTLEEAMSVT